MSNLLTLPENLSPIEVKQDPFDQMLTLEDLFHRKLLNVCIFDYLYSRQNNFIRKISLFKLAMDNSY